MRATPAQNNGVYYRRVLAVLPEAIKKASMSRLESLETLRPEPPEWYSSARETDRQYLKELIEEQGRLQNVLDKTLGDLQHDINAFAEPLLRTAMQSNFKNVKGTHSFNREEIALEEKSEILNF